jgi:hypothetical protein
LSRRPLSAQLYGSCEEIIRRNIELMFERIIVV